MTRLAILGVRSEIAVFSVPQSAFVVPRSVARRLIAVRRTPPAGSVLYYGLKIEAVPSP